MKLNVKFQESDRKSKIKRIIAREGLIIITSLILANLPAVVNTLFPHRESGVLNTGSVMREAYGNIVAIWMIPMYLVVHFILWAIKTLKEK